MTNVPPVNGWMGFDMAAIMERNSKIVEAQKEKAEQEKKHAFSKCDLCCRVEREVWTIPGPFPHLACVDADECSEYRWSIANPIMEV